MQLLSLAAAGAVVGLLVGLSASAVVSSLIGAVLTLAAAVIGGKLATPADEKQRNLSLLAFTLSLLPGLVGGLMLRTHDILSPSLESSVARWTAAGYTPAEARTIVAFERARIAPAGATKSDAPSTAATLLFDMPGGSLCGVLDAGLFPDAETRLQEMARSEPPWSRVKPLAEDASHNPETVAETAWQVLCAP